MLNDWQERLNDLEVLLYERGLGDPAVRLEMLKLCAAGFDNEVICMVHDFEEQVFNGELENF